MKLHSYVILFITKQTYLFVINSNLQGWQVLYGVACHRFISRYYLPTVTQQRSNPKLSIMSSLGVIRPIALRLQVLRQVWHPFLLPRFVRHRVFFFWNCLTNNINVFTSTYPILSTISPTGTFYNFVHATFCLSWKDN